MDRTKLTLSALLAAALVGDVMLISTGGQVVLVEAPSEAVEVKTADADVFKAEAANADARGAIRCEVGAISNHPDRCYCTDGGTAGWLSAAEDCKARVSIAEDGRVYAVDATLKPAGGTVK